MFSPFPILIIIHTLIWEAAEPAAAAEAAGAGLPEERPAGGSRLAAAPAGIPAAAGSLPAAAGSPAAAVSAGIPAASAGTLPAGPAGSLPAAAGPAGRGSR